MTVWHIDPEITYNGRPYPMRSRRVTKWPEGGVTAVSLGLLTAEQQRASIAVHELGHALIWLAAGLHVCDVSIPNSLTRGSMVQPGRMGHFIGLAAGERAGDRWLREARLWSPDLAVLNEYGGAADREQILSLSSSPPQFGADPSGWDFADLHDMADQELDVVWPQLMAAVPHLLAADEMTGDQLADLIGMTNPQHP